jgi:hypothetical protein
MSEPIHNALKNTHTHTKYSSFALKLHFSIKLPTSQPITVEKKIKTNDKNPNPKITQKRLTTFNSLTVPFENNCSCAVETLLQAPISQRVI